MSKTHTWTMAAVAAGTSAALLIGGASAALAHDRGQGGSAGRGPLSTLVTDGTLTTAQATAIQDALKAEHEANRTEHEAQMKADRAAVLADLVKKGTLTQAQADAVTAALAEMPAKGAGKGHGGKGHGGGKHGGQRR